MDEPTVDAAAARDAARLLVEAKRFADAQALLRDAANQARSAQDWSGLYVLLEALGALLRNQEQRVEAVSVFLDALWACRQAQGSADQLGRLEATLAFTLVNLGAADQAAEHAAAGLALAESMTRLDERVRTLNAVALTNTRLGHFQSARRLYAQIVREAKGAAGQAQWERGGALINLGVCFNDEALTLDAADPRRAQLLRRSIRCAKAALRTSLRPGHALAASLNCADSLLLLGSADEASDLLAALEPELQASRDTELRGFATGLRARVSLQRGEHDAAARLFAAAIELFESVASYDEVPGLLEDLSKAEEARSDLCCALKAERRASAMRRARARALSQTRMRVVEARYELELARRTAEAERTLEARIDQQRAQLTAQADAMSLAAHTDPLTGLGNRRMLEGISNLLKAPSETPFCVALIDVDHFKRVNDNFSHMVGDQVLRQIADIVRENCRPTDVAARYGGEEFALVLSGMVRDVGARVCERLRDRIEQFDWATIRTGLAVTVSIGLTADVCPADLKEALARADSCLYAAKNGGRNQVRLDG